MRLVKKTLSPLPMFVLRWQWFFLGASVGTGLGFVLTAILNC